MAAKRSKMSLGYKYKMVNHYVSKYPKFTTNEYVNRFVIEKLGEETMQSLATILREIIDKAYRHAKNEYGSTPFFKFS